MAGRSRTSCVPNTGWVRSVPSKTQRKNDDGSLQWVAARDCDSLMLMLTRYINPLCENDVDNDDNDDKRLIVTLTGPSALGCKLLKRHGFSQSRRCDRSYGFGQDSTPLTTKAVDPYRHRDISSYTAEDHHTPGVVFRLSSDCRRTRSLITPP